METYAYLWALLWYVVAVGVLLLAGWTVTSEPTLIERMMADARARYARINRGQVDYCPCCLVENPPRWTREDGKRMCGVCHPGPAAEQAEQREERAA